MNRIGGDDRCGYPMLLRYSRTYFTTMLRVFSNSSCLPFPLAHLLLTFPPAYFREPVPKSTMAIVRRHGYADKLSLSRERAVGREEVDPTSRHRPRPLADSLGQSFYSSLMMLTMITFHSVIIRKCISIPPIRSPKSLIALQQSSCVCILSLSLSTPEPYPMRLARFPHPHYMQSLKS